MNLTERIKNKFRKTIFKKIYQPKLIKENKLRLRNSDFSIICNNCLGGILYHDFGLKFLSPTINLYFEANDYLEFLENLEFYLNCEITDGSTSNEEIIGLLNNKLKLHAIHYSSFEELKSKWEERKQRVNFNNLFIIGSYRDGFNDELVQRFCNLPYKNKIFFSHKDVDCENNDCIVKLKCSKNSVEAPPADKMKSRKMRVYNAAFDFVSWINQK